MLISLYLVISEYNKMHSQKISRIVCNALEFICVPLYTEYLSDFHKKFQMESGFDTNVEY